MKKIFTILLVSIFIYANNLYFMPKDGKKAEKKIYSLFTHAKKEIDIVMYTFTNKKLARALKIAAKKGVKITIIADNEESKYKYSQIPKLALIKNIKVYLLSGKNYYNSKNKAKMHVKLSIIDKKTTILGSANYSYSAFYKNYEYILINDKDKYLTKRFYAFFHHLKILSTPYRLSR